MPAIRTRETTNSRNLEVSTDAPAITHTPTVSIISPTPRAFTFSSAITDNVRYVSPSTTPFESALHPDHPHHLHHQSKCLPVSSTPPPIRAFSPTSSIGSETSSMFSSPSVMSSQASHKRRRSVASDIERRPKKGDEDYIKRPENAFILFRRQCCEERNAEETSNADDGNVGTAPVKKQRQADLSKDISQKWKSLSAEEKAYWEEKAKEKKREHELKFPNYVYRPQRVKKGKKGKGKGEGEDTPVDDAISFILPVPSPPRSLSRDAAGPNGHGHGSSRRAASAPTPPPQYQTIQLPTVYMPSCPTSPSLVPRYSRRTPLPTHPIPHPNDSDPSTHFEYIPDDTLFPQFQRSNFDTNYPSHDSFQLFHFNNGQQPMAGDRQALTIHTDPSSSTFTASNMVSPTDSIATTNILSPADSIASSLSSLSPQGVPFSPGESLPISSLSINDSSSHSSHHHSQSHSSHHLDLSNTTPTPEECIDPELQSHSLSYGGYQWQPQSLWPESNELMVNDDFDLSNIPPVEISLSTLHHNEEESLHGCGGDPFDEYADMGSDAFEPYGGMEDGEEDEFGNHQGGGQCNNTNNGMTNDGNEQNNNLNNNNNHTPGAGHHSHHNDPFASLFSYDSMNW